MFPKKRKIEDLIETSIYGRIHQAIVLIVFYGLFSYFGMPKLFAYAEHLDSMFDSLPFRFGALLICVTLLVSVSLAIPTYRLMLIYEIKTPNPFISWSR